MNLARMIFVFISMGVTAVNGAGAITGRVVNGSSAALAYARVWLKNSPVVTDSTGADGKFALSITATAPCAMLRGSATIY
jgi:hypothetical protein